MICYAFPLKNEASRFLSHCTEKESFTINRLDCIMANYRQRRVLIVFMGMGLTLAEQNTETLLTCFRPKVVILAGYGGALVAQLRLGQVVISSNYTSEAILPFLRMMNGFDFANFCSTDEVMDTTSKREVLARDTQSQVVDMETGVVAEMVKNRNIPFMALRSISDTYRDVLPIGAMTAAYDKENNCVTPLRLCFYLALHPGEFTSFKRFVSGLPIARQSLTTFLEQLTDELPANW